MQKKVDFLVCGTQKGGTTALHSYLSKHPELAMANSKEVHFFDTDEYFNTPIPNYEIYHNFFCGCNREKLWGEVTPIYMYWNSAPQRIFSYNPNIKIILLLRNPIERAYSHWNMERSRNADNLSFSDALAAEEKRLNIVYPTQDRIHSYIDRGRYPTQLFNIFKWFDRRNVLILKSEYLNYSPRACLNEICNFLGISCFDHVLPIRKNVISYESKMGLDELKYLISIFKPEIALLERLLGWDCRDWIPE